MVWSKRARTAETPKQPSSDLRLRAPYFYPDPALAFALHGRQRLVGRASAPRRGNPQGAFMEALLHQERGETAEALDMLETLHEQTPDDRLYFSTHRLCDRKLLARHPRYVLVRGQRDTHARGHCRWC